MTEQEIIASVRQAREEEFRFFSRAAKNERERWVVGEFLTRLGVEFSTDELDAGPDPPDVIFRSASFEIKEICDSMDLRHARVKESLQLARQATNVRDLFGASGARDIILDDLAKLLAEIAGKPKYSVRDKSTMDLLAYVTRPHTGFNERYEVAADKLKSFGWRSISCLFGQKPLLLVATDSSPPFLCPN